MTERAPRYEKPESLARIPQDNHAVIEASAGTGKTYALEHLVLELLLVRRLPIEQILAVTFTDKAAREFAPSSRSSSAAAGAKRRRRFPTSSAGRSTRKPGGFSSRRSFPSTWRASQRFTLSASGS